MSCPFTRSSFFCRIISRVALNPGPDFCEKFNQIGNKWRPYCHGRQTRSIDQSLNTKANNYFRQELLIHHLNLHTFNTIPVIGSSVSYVNIRRPKRYPNSLIHVKCLPFNASPKHFLSLCVLNIRSVRNKSAILQDYVCETGADIIALTVVVVLPFFTGTLSKYQSVRQELDPLLNFLNGK